jgi:S-DNA-T family DNA segregation ATPase FtsK/SpoIIIE
LRSSKIQIGGSRVDRGWLTLAADAGSGVIQPHEHEVPVRLDGLPIGLGEDGQVYRLPLLGNHVVTPGVTGAGKSALIWSIIYQLAPAIADGSVQLSGAAPVGPEVRARKYCTR